MGWGQATVIAFVLAAFGCAPSPTASPEPDKPPVDPGLSGTWKGPYTMVLFGFTPGGARCTFVFEHTWTVVQTGSDLAITVSYTHDGNVTGPCTGSPTSDRYDTRGTVGAGGAVTVQVRSPTCPPLTGTVQDRRMTLTTGCPGTTEESVVLTKQ